MPESQDGLLSFQYSPYTQGVFYLYVAYKDAFSDISFSGDDWWIEIQDYCVIEVNINSLRQELDNDLSLTCESGVYCMTIESVVPLRFGSSLVCRQLGAVSGRLRRRDPREVCGWELRVRPEGVLLPHSAPLPL